MFVYLTKMDGAKVCVNADHIKTFEPLSDKISSIILFINKDYVMVKESFDELCVLLDVRNWE